jgi:glycosyltransferase involved in cell wall biosynthesis
VGTWPRITIVTPSYNQGQFLEETLRSVLLQAYPKLEYVVIDGASTDGSVEILRSYGPWLTSWTSEPDGGQSEAINKGFALATGEIVTFLASDDVYEPGTLHDVARRFREHPDCGAVIGAFRFMDEASRRAPEVHPPRLPGPGPHDLTLLDPASWRIHQVSTFYSRRALDAVGRRVREDLRYTMDRELLYRLCRRYPVALADRVYAAFRRHPESKSMASIVPMWREMADLHLLDAPADEAPSVRRRRRALWRQRRARGWIKLARSGVGGWTAAAALARAAFYRPGLLGRRHYLVAWLAAFGLLPPARRARGLMGPRPDEGSRSVE